MEVFLKRAWLAVALWLAACVSTGPLTEAEVRALSTRTWSGAIDDVFDATWLTLRERGFEVFDVDRLAGTLKARREAREWNIDVAAVGAEQRVVLSVETPVTRAELSQVLEVLEEGTARRVRAWNDIPEWTFDARRNLLVVPGFAVSPPLEWQWLDFDLNRRVVTVQKARSRSGANQTMVVEIDRTRPESKQADLGRRAIGLALAARTRLSFPDELKQGTVRVLDGTTPLEVTWRVAEYELDLWQVRVAVACAGAECLALPAPVMTK